MTDMDEFRRFNAGVCNPAVVDAADRWIAMPEETKERLRLIWAEIDAEQAKIVQMKDEK